MTKAERDAKALELAQIEIKRICQKAVREDFTPLKTRREVGKIIKDVLARIETPSLKETAAEALMRFAIETLERFRSLKTLVRGVEELAKGQRSNAKVKALLKDRSSLDANLMRIAENPAAYNVEPGARLYFREYHDQVKETLDKIIKSGAAVQYEKRVNLRNIAEMTVRYDKQIEMINELKDEGEDLVWIEPHANCSIRCQKWQGKLYSISGRSGKIDGIPFQPLSNATEATVTSKSGRTWVNGCITGYNCRHKLLPYRGKESKPVEIPAKIVKQQREAEEKMRAMEREIRYQKEAAEFLRTLFPDKAAEARKKAKSLTSAYEKFSAKNALAFTRERTRVVKGENVYARKNGITLAP